MKRLLYAILSIFLICPAKAANDPLETCLNKISNNDTAWISGISSIFGNSDLDDTVVEQNKARIYNLISNRFQELCGSELVHIAKTNKVRGQIDFKHKDKDYAFDFDVDKIFDNLGIQMGILVINKHDLYPTKVLSLSDIPRKQKFFSSDCSDHFIFDNLDDDAAVNKAGQSVFSEYGGSQHEFFLDFAEGDNRRAFPGLVIQDKTGSTGEQIVSYTNIKTAVERTQQFAENLKNSQCSNQGLSVYLVALNVQQSPYKTSDNKDVAATTTTAVAGAGLTAGIIGSTVAAAAWIPVAGWIVAGVAGAAAGTIALLPQSIADIQQVMVLDGPYNL
nr:hypothetical protein [Candidatus Enterousia merdequi]